MLARCFALCPTAIHARSNINLCGTPLAIVFSRNIKPPVYRHLATSTTPYDSPRDIRKTLIKLVSEKSADRLLSTVGFARRTDALLPVLDHLVTKLGVKDAVRLLSSGSFCAHHETLLPVFETLSEKLGTKHAVTLLSKDSFCARAESLLPVLDRLSDKLGKESAVRLFSSGSFCLRADELMAKYPDIEAVLGAKGAVLVLSNDSLASMDATQWQEFMDFIRKAQPGDVVSYLGSRGTVSKCKKVGWGKCADLYQKASEQEKTGAVGFKKLVDAYAQ
ncbi:hypothetical protein HDU77_008173 [Chytriomyces hyalinus]|nr:hypothetical protein HDU77_008173 [Chytriomyces hyalinus]